MSLVRDAGGITSDDATVHVARLFGWARTGSGIQARLGSTVEDLVSSGRLVRTEGELGAPIA